MLDLDGHIGDVGSDRRIVIAPGVLPGDIEDVEPIFFSQPDGIFVPNHGSRVFDGLDVIRIRGLPGLDARRCGNPGVALGSAFWSDTAAMAACPVEYISRTRVRLKTSLTTKTNIAISRAKSILLNMSASRLKMI